MAAMDLHIEILGPQRDDLGECPLWDERHAQLYWIDSHKPAIFRLDTRSGERREWGMPTPIGSIALCQSGRLLVALADELIYLDPATGQTEALVRVPHAAEGIRLNDGRVDREGRFCVGSLVRGRPEPLGALYQVSANGRLVQLDQGVRVANTTCFSPDGRWLYFADSLARQIWRYAYDSAAGQVGPRQVWVDWREAGLSPDGATVDADGQVWVALVMQGQLACVSPEGQLLRRIDVPVEFPTCPCFGGADLRTLYLSSIRHSGNLLHSERAESGALLALHGLGAQGLPEGRFADC